MAELNGRPVGLDEITALALTNYGHFTTLRVDDGRVRGLALHLDRLGRDCTALFGAELDPDRVQTLVRRVTPARGAATVRVTVFDPALDIGRPDRTGDPHILVTHRQASSAPLPPLRVRSVAYTRDAPEVKSVGLFASLRHRRTARLAGYDDALFVDGQAYVSEGVTWNIGFFDGDTVVWPDAVQLAGVTMRLLQDAHKHRVAPVALADAGSLHAAFATNAAIGVRAITAIDGTEFTDHHPAVDLLREIYADQPGDLL
ncbi:aminotransferase class IV family protein [Streptomyces sp. NBC_00872]|uniref:aminotransferase class IV family protein n=1 Tax=Streptomyces sp. NBC_00872 TaxID=2903686 RepID=UPI00386A7778|nr:aminotransferase class IV family protein [Streptomyces sp. NBC_00872]